MPGAPRELLTLLRGVSDWFARRERSDGSIVCPRHGVEHGGKTIYTASIDLWLAERTDSAAERAELEGRAARRVRRALDRVREDPRTGAAVFLPGSLDHRNASSNLIDSGACADVIGEVLERRPDLFGQRTGHARDVLAKVAGTYLVRAVVEKEVPAQRLWGATGLARAARVLGEERFAEAALRSVDRLIEQAHPDGSIPYLPEPGEYGEHAGQSDVSTYYHSRHIGFAVFVHQLLERRPEERVRAFVERSLDFLDALYGRDGLKPLAVEAKQWYWESSYEVASHAFDVHAMLAGADWTAFAERLRYRARLSFERILDHVEEDGAITSHRGEGTNFQCRDFWNAHLVWLARAAEALPDRLPDEPSWPPVRVFADAGWVRLDRADWTAGIRGRKQPTNISFGGSAGGGTLVTFGRRSRGFEDEIGFPKWSSTAPGSFTVVPRRRPPFRRRVMDFYLENRRDVRFRLYVANVERKAEGARRFLEYPIRHVVQKLRDELKGRYASHFDVSPSMTTGDGGEIRFASMPARRDGRVLPGAQLNRCFRPAEEGLFVEEDLLLEEPVRAVLYTRIETASDFRLETEAAVRENGATLVISPRSAPTRIRVSYRLGDALEVRS